MECNIFGTHSREKNWYRTQIPLFFLYQSYGRPWRCQSMSVFFFFLNVLSKPSHLMETVSITSKKVTILKISLFVWKKLLFFQLSNIPVICLQHGSASVQTDTIDIFLPCSNCMSASILFWYSRNFWSRLSENMSTAVDFVDDFLIKLSVELW